MKQSESIASLAAALAKAQGEMKSASKDSENPYFKSKYADLASIWNACREPLSKNGLAVIQIPRVVENFVEIETMLCHSSGEFISEVLRMPLAKADVQGTGSAITYGRRYALAAITGIAPEDDDGNSAVGGSAHSQPERRQEPKEVGSEDLVRIITHNIRVMKTTGQLLDCRDKYLSKNLPADAVKTLDDRLLEKMELLIRSLPNGDQLDICVEGIKNSEKKKEFNTESFARVGQAVKDKVAALVGTNGDQPA